MRNRRRLRLIRPTPVRDVFYQLIILGIFSLPVYFAPVVWVEGWIRWLVFAVFFLLWLIPLTFTISSWAGGIYRVQEDAKKANFYLKDHPGDYVNAMLAGAGVQSAVYSGVALGEAFDPRTYAGDFDSAHEAVLLVEFPWVYDERRLFEELHQQFLSSGHSKVTITYHSMSTIQVDRFPVWLRRNHPASSYTVEAVQLVNPAFKLRAGQKTLLRLGRPYKGGPVVQAMWMRVLWKLFWPESAIAKARCEADGRMNVFNHIRHESQALSMDMLLHTMSALLRGAKLRNIREAPPFKLKAVDIATDTVVAPQGNEAALVRRYGTGNFLYSLVLGMPSEIGLHGMMAEFGPQVYAELASDFRTFRDA